MKKILKSNLFIMVFVGVVSSLTTVVASNYLATDIAYTPKDGNWNVNNVGGAIEELYLYSSIKTPVGEVIN